jgi:hypothetical protein
MAHVRLKMRSGAMSSDGSNRKRRDDRFLQQAGEVVLGQVVRLVSGMAFVSDEGIDWIPVRLAQLRQRGAGVWARSITRGDDSAPLGRRELGRATGLGHDFAHGIVGRDGTIEQRTTQSTSQHHVFKLS